MDTDSFSSFCFVLESISQTKKRLEIQNILQTYIKQIKNDKNTLIAVLYLSTATFYPEHFGKQLGVGETALYKLVSETTGKKLKNIRDEMRITGDLGSIAMKYKISSFVKTSKKLSVADVLGVLREISDESGSKSGQEKLNKMIKLVVMSSGIEIKYLLRLFEGKLKIGLATKTVLISLAMAFDNNGKVKNLECDQVVKKLRTSESDAQPKSMNINSDMKCDTLANKPKTRESDAQNRFVTTNLLSKKDEENNSSNTDMYYENQSLDTSKAESAIDKIKFVYNQCPIFEEIVDFLTTYGIEDIDKHLKIKPGVPVKPMLAQPSKNLTAAFKRVEGCEFTCEYKYDGERAQIHRFENKYKVFSRNSEDLTEKYPDLKDVLSKIEKNGKNFILDAEVVAYCPVEKRILPFQLLTTRKRKDVKLEEIKINICLFLFDCLYYGSSLLEKQLSKRRDVLLSNFIESENLVQFVKKINCDSVDEIEAFFTESIKSGCEGLMVKNLQSLYKPSNRSSSWVKLKKDYLEGMCDSLDLLVLGAYYGKGKRTGTYGGFLIGSYDNENDVYEAVCKIGTGFGDEMLQRLYREMEKYIINTPSCYVYTENVKPDIWLAPRFIFEVKAAGFSVSPIYSAANKLNKNGGISLRFPRFIKLRDDKNVKDVTTSKQVLYMFNEFTTENEASDDLFN